MTRILAPVLALLILLGAHSAHADCVSPAGVAGEIVYNADFRVDQYCDDTEWVAMGPVGASCALGTGPFVEVDAYDTPGEAQGVWGDGAYIYVADWDRGVHALTFDGVSFTSAGSYDTPGNAEAVWGDGTYLYVADRTSGIHAFTFDGVSFTSVGSYNTPFEARGVWGDGNYIYVADDNALRAYSFNGTAFTEEGAYVMVQDSAMDVWGDGTYIYAADHTGTGIRAFTFNGSSFTLAGATSGKSFRSVWGDGTYVYAVGSASSPTLVAYTFNGSSFTEAGGTNGGAFGIWGDGVFIYGAGAADGVFAHTFNGAVFSQADSYDTPGGAGGVWGDGTYIYVADGASGIRAYSGFQTCGGTNENGYFVLIGNGPANSEANEFDGNLGGLSGANATCLSYLQTYDWNGKTAAQNSGMLTSDNVKAWLCDDSACQNMLPNRQYEFATTQTGMAGNGGSAFFTDSNGFYPSTNSNSWNGATYFNRWTYFHTGRLDDHTPSANNCSNWTSGAAGPTRMSGDSLATDSQRWEAFTLACNTRDQYICFVNPGDCSSPSGADGEIVYNENWSVMQYCDGAQWQPVGKRPVYTPNAVTFDGTNDYLTRGTVNLTGVADSGLVTGSFWVRRNGGFGTAQTIYRMNQTNTVSNVNRRFLVQFDTANRLHLFGQTVTPTTILDATSAAQITDTGWHHVMFSIDLSDSGKRHIYIDGAADAATWSTYTAGSLDFSMSTPRNSLGGTHTGTVKLNGDLADVWLAPGVYVDLSQASNRAKFLTSAGKPVNLDSDGSAPTGTAPLVFFSGVTSTWHTNDGTGGGFTLNGALTDAFTDPGSCYGSGGFIEAGSYNTPGSATSLWSDGSYIYVADDTSGIRAYTFNGSTFTEAGSFDTPGAAWGVWGDGTYIYVADDTSGIRAYTFNGSTFTEAGSFDTPFSAKDVIGDGTYLYVADDDALRAYTFNGTTFTEVGVYAGVQDQYKHIWGDGTYIYAGGDIDPVELRAFTFNGTAFTLAGSHDRSSGVRDVWGDGTYIYVADSSGGAQGYTFNGAAFTLAINSNIPQNGNWGVWGDGTYIYMADGTNGFGAFTHNGSVFSDTAVSYVNTPGFASAIWGDGTYIYVADGASGIRAYSGLGNCRCAAPAGDAGEMLYNTDENLIQYCDGEQWIKVGK